MADEKKKSKFNLYQTLFDVGFFLVILWAIFNIWMNLGYSLTEVKVNSIDTEDDITTTYVSYTLNGQEYDRVEMPNYKLTEDEQSSNKIFHAYISKSNPNLWVNRDLAELFHSAILPGLLLIVIGYCFDEKNIKERELQLQQVN